MMQTPEDPHKKLMIDGLDLNGTGLEIAPLFRPILSKSECKIFYTDFTTAEDLRKKNKDHPALVSGQFKEIVDIDFVWFPGKRLAKCLPENTKFDFVLASHVFEHVPNPIDWLLNIFEVMKIGGILSLALPDKRECFDAFRQETQVSELIDAWVRGVSIPTPKQIYDCLSHAFDATGPKGVNLPFEEATRLYSDQQALDFAKNAWDHNNYIDVHCSAFTPEGLTAILNQLNKLKILNIAISPWTKYSAEFGLQLTKMGETPVKRIKNRRPNILLDNMSLAKRVLLRKIFGKPSS